jgi:hypothetical protein
MKSNLEQKVRERKVDILDLILFLEKLRSTVEFTGGWTEISVIQLNNHIANLNELLEDI